jgi:hypothetical protein
VPGVIGAGVVSVLGLPLSGALHPPHLIRRAGSAPLVIVGVVVAYLVKLAVEARWGSASGGSVPA